MESLVNTQQEVIAQTKMQLHFLRNNIRQNKTFFLCVKQNIYLLNVLKQRRRINFGLLCIWNLNISNYSELRIMNNPLDLTFSYRHESKQDDRLPIPTIKRGHSLELFSKINLIFRRGRKIIRSLVFQRKQWFWRLWS